MTQCFSFCIPSFPLFRRFASLDSFFRWFWQERDLLKSFQISSKTFVDFMVTLEAHYLQVPYHNSSHAADVVQSVHILLLSPALEVLKPFLLFSFLLLFLRELLSRD